MGKGGLASCASSWPLTVGLILEKDRIIMGAERKTSFISEEVKKMTAYHEVCLLSFNCRVFVRF